jgi:hypothetical protein
MAAEQRLNVTVAGITLRTVLDDPQLLLRAEETTRPFRAPDEAAPDSEIRAVRGEIDARPPGRLVFDSGSLWRLFRDEGAYRFRFTARAHGPVPYKEAVFCDDFSRGRVVLNRAVYPEGAAVYPCEYPLDELVMIGLLGQGLGAELHGCGIVDARAGRGHLFLGESGAGKTTTARLWQRHGTGLVLSDDRIIVRRTGAGWWMYGTPWHGEGRLAAPRGARLDRVYFLRQGRRNELVPCAGARAVQRLFACSFPPFYRAEGLAFTLGFLEGVSREVPCAELTFRPDAGVVSFVCERAA